MNLPDVYIVTLKFDSTTFEKLQALRVRYFPSLLNFIPAHLTLLHSVSLDQVMRLKDGWNGSETIDPPDIHFTGVRSLGRGTALTVESSALHAVRDRSMQIMAGDFSRQDRQAFKPHVTIQNKVEPAAAKELLERLSATFVAWNGNGRGLMIWRYLGGPWSLDIVLPFKNRSRTDQTAQPTNSRRVHGQKIQ